MRLNVNKPFLFIFISIILLLLVGVFSYYLYLMPLYNQVDQKKTELDIAEQQVKILESKIDSTGSKTSTNTVALQKKVPVKRLLDQALLEIEKAEIISGTNIIEITINGTDADEAVSDEELTTADKAIEDANKQDSGNDTEEEATEEVVLPSGIHQTKISIVGEANNYFELEKFLEKLGSSDRIMTIDTFNLTGPKEITNVDDSDQVIDFDVSLSIYYYPTLNDLIGDLPPLETPEVSDRKNPFDTGTLEKKEEEQP